MELLFSLLENILVLANAMSFYILLGLLIAGILKQLIPDDFIASHLGDNKTASVLKATLFGIPMPVCSCSVIPLAKSLQKEGASKGAVQSFLISTPITGADSILATYSFFGWFFTIYRVITSVIIAIVTGLLQNLVENKEISKNEENSCCSSCCCGAEKPKEKKRFSLKESFTYAYVTLFKDIYKALLIGLVIGGLFTTFLPKEIIAPLFEYQILTYFAVLIIAMPLYVCATASLPIAAAFMISGMSPGAAFVFLSAGPATNTVTMGVVAQMFGKKALMIYLGTISLLSILFGYFFDTFFGELEILNMSTEIEELSILDTLSTVIMLGLIAYYFIKRGKQ
jgi:uncharacterized membrane protein YraQ (UPF0718 family)